MKSADKQANTRAGAIQAARIFKRRSADCVAAKGQANRGVF
jgi:hypothetical protein